MGKKDYRIGPADGTADLFKCTLLELARDIAVLLVIVPVIYSALVFFLQLGAICH